MKKFLISAITLTLALSSCSSDSSQNDATEELHATTRNCYSTEHLANQIAADPSLAIRMQQVEEFTKQVLRDPNAMRVLADGTLEIPVHVNVLYNKTAENVSNAQIQSQIDVLNEDFGGYNPDYSDIPAIFQDAASGDIKIRFVWSQENTTRKKTNKRSWRTNDDIKKSSRGGIDPTNCSTTLNIWVGVLSNNILGYAQFPGGNCATDGVVIHTNAFGRGNYALFSSFNKGRTATHEVGHYFNLRHIWGDATCGNDFVADTPTHNTSNGGCPTFPHYSTCSGTPVEMTMNYMDYTNDACMYMFTSGQAARMQATYTTGGPRASLR